jgi:hypothetical protein
MSVHLTQIGLKTIICKQNICVRLGWGKYSLSFVQVQSVSTAQVILHALLLCWCFCLPTVGSSEQAYFQHSVLSRRTYKNIQTFTPPDFASDKTATMFWPRKEGAKLFNPLCSYLPAIASNGTFYPGIILFPISLFLDERLEIFGTFGVCICVCVFMYVWVYVYVLRTYVYMHARMYVCMYVCVYVCMYVCMYCALVLTT